MKIKYLFIAALMLPLMVSAQSLSDYVGTPEIIGFHTLTHHDPQGDSNNINPGIYLITDKGLTVGTYFNSHRRETFYAGWTTPEWYRFKISFLVATGYKPTPAFVVVPSFRLYTFENGVNVRIIAGPKVDVTGQSIVHILIDWKF